MRWFWFFAILAIALFVGIACDKQIHGNVQDEFDVRGHHYFVVGTGYSTTTIHDPDCPADTTH